MPKASRGALLALLLASPLALAQRPVEPARQRAEEEARLAKAQAHGPRAAAALIRLHALEEETDDLHLFARTYAELATRPSAHPQVRDLARTFAAKLERARGRQQQSQQWQAPLGRVHDFFVVGGFDNEGKAGCDTVHGPEQGPVDLSARYPGKAREVGWRRLELAPRDGYIDLSSALRPQKEVVAFALTVLDAPEDTAVELSLGTSGAYRLFLNGEQVAKDDRYHPPRPDQTRLQLSLSKGPNQLLLKLCQESGPLGFGLRQVRAPGARARAEIRLPAKGEPLPPTPKPRGPRTAKSLPTLATLLEAEVRRRPGDASLRADWAAVLAHTRAYEERERTATVQAREAAEQAPNDARLQLFAAQAESEDPNLRRAWLERALKLDPKSPAARLALAEHELSREHPERALGLLDPLLQDFPDDAAAHLAKARAHEALGEWPKALAVVEAALLRFPRHPKVVREGVRAARRLDRLELSAQRYRVALALRHDDAQSRRGLAGLLADLGRTDEATQELEAHLLQDPFDLNARLRLAELFVHNGRAPEAFSHFEAALALCPDEPELHEAHGRALLAQERKDEALFAFERSLALRPQNPRLKEAVRALKAEGPGYGLRHVVDWRPLMKEAAAHTGEDAVYLVDGSYVRVHASGLSSRFHQMAVQVLTTRGVDAFRTFSIGHSPNRQEIRILKARIVKPDGSVVESYHESERAMNEPWSGMYYDSRMKQLSFPALAKGDVLELWYRLDDTARDNLLSDYWGDVEMVQGTHPKVRYQYLVDMPKERPLYWNRSEVPASMKTESTEPEAGRTVYRFASSGVPKLVPEPQMPGWAEVAQMLHVSTYRTWEDVGRYYWGLVRDQLTPDAELRRTVEQVLANVDRKDELAVVRAVYNFVVTNTRYVALEFGIHGYKPYRVDRVLARRFGDCKDKASLIHAMLKVAGVDSKLVLLRMRHLGAIGEEPASLAAFNHAILYVPRFDLYLDGTAEFHGAKELPTADRTANILVVEPEGSSRFLAIPEAKAEDNQTRLAMKVQLQPDGSATLEGESVVTGINAPDYRRNYQAAATRSATFERAWAQLYPGLKVESVELNDLTRLDEDIQLRFRLQAPRFAEVLPRALRFHPFGSGLQYVQRFAPLPQRRFDLVLQAPMQNRFSYRFALPPGAVLDGLPAPLEETTPFGKMTLTHRLEGRELVSEGQVELSKARVPAQEYPAFRAFLGRVDQAFSRKVVLRLGPASPDTARATRSEADVRPND